MQKSVTHAKVFRFEKPAQLFFNPGAECLYSRLKEKHQINWDSFLAVLEIIIILYIFSKLYFIVLVAN